MDDDAGAAGLGRAGPHNQRRLVGVVAALGARVDLGVVRLGHVGDDGEARDAAAVTVGLGLGKLAGRDLAGPVSRLEEVVVAGRVSEAGIEVLELPFAVVVEQPVEELLVVRSTRRSAQRRGEQITASGGTGTHSIVTNLMARSCSVRVCHMDRSWRKTWLSMLVRPRGVSCLPMRTSGGCPSLDPRSSI